MRQQASARALASERFLGRHSRCCRLVVRTVVVGCLGGLIVLVACAKADPYGELPEDPAALAASEAATCSSTIEGKDPRALKTCTGTKAKTKGRCAPKALLGSFKDTFEQADCGKLEACLPDALVKDGSNVELTHCKAIRGTDGRCFWPLAKDIIASYDLLAPATKGQCGDGQVCAPCKHPVTGKDTGVCHLGSDAPRGLPPCKDATGLACPQVEPILDESSFDQLDCPAGMLCVDPSLVGADRAAILPSCTRGVCGPTKSIVRGGNYVPKTCRSLLNAEGRCTHASVPSVAAQKDRLPKADCDDGELCAPCFDPTTGKPTAACTQAPCDHPAEPPKTLAACCGGAGKCVSAELAGEQAAASLATDTCTGDTPFCAPSSAIPGGPAPTTCSAVFGIVSKGVCTPKCTLNLNGLLEMIQGNCANDEMCVPCSRLPPGSAGCN